MSKKVLIITYYWPPAGGPGVQRWLKFTKYLPEFNIEPIVYCPENPSYPITDLSLLSEVSDKVKVIKRPIREPYAIAKLFSKRATEISSGIIPPKRKQSLIENILLYIRGNFFIPDARKQWVEPSFNFLRSYIEEHQIKTIITTGPPHSIHLIGLKLRQNLPIKWIADFRDPWTTIGYQKELKLTKSSVQKHRNLEHQVLNSADEIIVTSNFTKKEFSSKTQQPITTITNGYDNHHVTIDSKDDKFTIAHIGSLLSNRNPEVLWEVLHELTIENKDFSKEFKLVFIGVVSSEIINTLKLYGLGDYLELRGYLDHSEAIKAQMSAQLLLLIEINSEETKAIIPGKLFEYMISETPILAIGPKESDVQDIIKNTNTGSYFSYSDKQAIKSQILEYFQNYKKGSLKTVGIGLKPYSRRELTKNLAKLL